MRAHGIKALLNTSRVAARPGYASVFVLAAMIVTAAILQKNFFSQSSLTLTADAFGPLVLLTMGQAVVMISGALDLSSGAALSLYTCVLTEVMRSGHPMTGVLALVLTAFVAVLVGVINGIGAAYMRISSVVVTFATSFIWLGLALFIRPTPGGESVNWFGTFFSLSEVAGAPEWIRTFGHITPPVLVLIAVACTAWFIISRTKVGRYIYAVGGDDDSAYRSGINAARVRTIAYVINALFVFLAALFFVGQNQSGDARFGDPFTLQTIAAAVVGGISLSGGRGSVYSGIIGALIIEFVNKIIFFANVPYAYGTLIAGLIVIFAIAMSRIYTLYSQHRLDKGQVSS